MKCKTVECPHCDGSGRMMAFYITDMEAREGRQGTSTLTGMEQFHRSLAFQYGTPYELRCNCGICASKGNRT